jgi:branched-chain amino acid transport system substrate-binding protein
MRSNRLPRWLPFCLSASLLCLGRAALAGPEGPQQQGPVLVVPGTLPLTGPDASSGIAFKEGYELAVSQVNARGGLAVGGQRRPVALDLVDDRGDKSGAGHAAERLIDKHHAAFMLGTFGAAPVAAQASVAEMHRVNYVAASGSSAKIFRRGFRFSFGVQTPVDTMAQSELDWIAERQAAGELPRPARLSVSAGASPAGAEFQQAVLAQAKRSPEAFEIVAPGSSDADPKAGSDCVSKIQTAGADVILQAVWWNEKLPGNPESAAFVHAFRTRYHRVPDWQHALAHEAARALFTAIEQAGTLEAEEVRARLAALHLRSLLPGGELSFPAASGQQARYPFLLLQGMPDGSAAIVSPAFAATASLTPAASELRRQLAAAR